MLGQFNLLPFLKGWEYKVRRIVRDSVIRGADPIELRESELGWLMHIWVISTDCYGTLKITWQGANLETTEAPFYAERFMWAGALAQDPAGWLQKYFRPNPASTAGIFGSTYFSGGYQGAAWPYIPTVTMGISLPADSTQDSAYIEGVAFVMVVTKPKLFLESLRAIEGIKGKLDPNLFVLGPEPMGEQL